MKPTISTKPRSAVVIQQELKAAEVESDNAEAAMDELHGHREILLLDGSDEAIRKVEKEIDNQRLRMERAEKRREVLSAELTSAARDEIIDPLVARADELRVNQEARDADRLRRLKGACAAVAAILAEINQENMEREDLNRAMPDGHAKISIPYVTIRHIPGHGELSRWLTSLFPMYGFDEPIVVSVPGRAAYPAAVRSALAQRDEQRRAEIAAARAPSGERQMLQQPTFVTLPGFADEPPDGEPSPSSVVRTVHGFGRNASEKGPGFLTPGPGPRASNESYE